MRPRTVWQILMMRTCAVALQAAVAASARVEAMPCRFWVMRFQIICAMPVSCVLHKHASLDELGRLTDPPMTKDAVAGRIRRLLVMADSVLPSWVFRVLSCRAGSKPGWILLLNGTGSSVAEVFVTVL